MIYLTMHSLYLYKGVKVIFITASKSFLFISCKEYLAVINYNISFNSNYNIAIKQRKVYNNG